MARLIGPDMGSRAVFLPNGRPAEGRTGVVFADGAATTIADIAAYQPGDPTVPGAVIPGSIVTVDANGLLPLFWFPLDGTDRLWVSVNGGPVVPIDADYGARLDRVESRKADTFSIYDYGAVGDGGTDDTSAVEATVAAAVAAGGGIVWFGMNHTVKLTHRIDLPVGRVAYKGNGVTLDCSTVPDGDLFAVRFVPDTTDALVYTNWVEGVRILGPLSEARTLDGVFIGRLSGAPSGNVAGFAFRNVAVRGFRDNWVFGDQSWLFGFFQCASLAAWRRGYNIDAATNAGENYNFHGGVVADCRNAGGTAVGLYLSQAGAADVHCHGMSFDYDNVEVDVQSGTLSLHGCHLENYSTVAPMVRAVATGGFEHTTVSLLGCQVSPTEATTRPCLVELTGDNTYFTAVGTKWNTFNRGGTELARVLSGTPGVRFVGGDVVVGGTGVAPLLSKAVNVLQNGDFEAGTLAGWTTGGTVTYTAQSVTKNSGTWAAKIAGTGVAGTTSAAQKFPVRPGETVHLAGYLAADTMTAGNTVLRIVWKGADGTTTVGSAQTIATVSANQAFTFVGSRRTVPTGVAYCQVELLSTNLAGNVYADDLLAAVL